MQPPNEARHFVHRRLFGAAKGLITGGPTGAASGFLSGGRPSTRSGGQPAIRVRGSCPPGQRLSSGGNCLRDTRTKKRGLIAFGQRVVPGGRTGFTGDAVMGQFGAALEPIVEDRMVRTCLPGMVLGKDGLCYNRRDLSNKEREYPKGTRPLGTPGEMAALRKAASFGRRMETTVKRMQKIGVLKKPGRRAPPPRPAQKLLPAGTSIVNVE